MRDYHGARLVRALQRYRSGVAVEHETGALTYAELDAWSGAVADQLHDLGARPGTPVALLVGNDVEFVVAAVAVARSGAAKVPVNPVLPASVVTHLLTTAGVAVLVVGPGLEELAAASVRDLTDPPALVAVAQGALNRSVAMAPLPPAGRTRRVPDPVDVDPALPAVLQFTGGTTGRPKGAIQDQRGTAAFHLAQLVEGEIRQHERLLLTTPLSHAAGAFAESALTRGATVLLHRSFDAGRVVRSLREDAVSWVFLVPTMLYRILDLLPRDHAPEDLALDTVLYGAAPISPRRLGDAVARLGRVFVQLYGQTECPVWGTRLGKSDHDPARPELLASCGRASWWADVRVVDAGGQPVPPGTDGEIALRAPYAMAGYVGDPEATRAKLVDGWVLTGDLGVLDEDGYVYLKDRKSDLIVSGGMNVYSTEVEVALAAHPAILAAAVVGVPHDDWGEAVHAVLVASEPVATDELRDWCRERVAGYAVPKTVEVVDALPETPFGKVDKRALRARYWKDAARAIN